MNLPNIDPLLMKLKQQLSLHFTSTDTVIRGIQLYFERCTSYGRKVANQLLDYVFHELDITNNLTLLDNSLTVEPLKLQLRALINGLHYLGEGNEGDYVQYISGALYELANART